MMNQKAQDLGLTSTHFVTPHGLDQDEHYTTAYELAKLANYALKNTTFARIVNTSHYSVNINGHLKPLNNTNELLGYLDGVYGVKTGFTNGANRCLVTSCKRGNLDIICVVLGCDTKKDRTLDSINLINYTFNNFSVVNIKDIVYKNFDNWKSENSNSFNINKGVSSNLDLYFNENDFPYTTVLINNSLLDKVSTSINYISNFEAPLCENTVIGVIEVKVEDKTLFNLNILNKNKIERKSTGFYIMHFMNNYFDYLSA